jgi:hypothetical protein
LPRIRWNRAIVSVWVNEQTCPMCSAPLTVSGGVSMEKTASRGLAPVSSVPPGSVPLSAAGSNLYYPGLFPPARPLLLDALKRRLERHRAGLAHAGAR